MKSLLLILVIVLLAGSGLTLSSCSTRSSLISPSVDLSDDTLNQFTDYQRTLLLRHLASSARWQLKDHNGTLNAIRRQEICGVLQMSFNGAYASGPSSDRSWSEVILMMQPYQPSESEKERVTVATAGTAAPVPLRLRQYKSEYISELVVSGHILSLYIRESSSHKERQLTQEALLAVNQELATVLTHQQELSEKGYVQEAIPGISVIQSKISTLNVSDEACRDSRNGRGACALDGLCQVSAYINPGEAGYAYIKVFIEQTDKQLCAEDIYRRSTENVGWSDNPSDKFFYDVNITICEEHPTGHIEDFPARFELWFHPDSGGTERELLEVTQTVSTRRQ
jgi:hypothetical protein